MKKLSILLMTLGFVLFLAACGSADSGETGESGETAESGAANGESESRNGDNQS